jgi:hypothetical protein
MGKSHDGFAPSGPWLVTCDEVVDPHNLMIRTTVNGEEEQLGSTGDMTHCIYEQVAALTSRCTLEPGDLVTTGSPAGSAHGRTPPPWLAVGDLIRVEVEGIGALENRIVPDTGEPLVAGHLWRPPTMAARRDAGNFRGVGPPDRPSVDWDRYRERRRDRCGIRADGGAPRRVHVRAR